MNVAVGINMLRTMMPRISEKGGLATIYTNHSLRATAASRLFANNIPEKVIQEKTGHRSLAGLRAYERVTTEQDQAVSKVLESDSTVKEFNKENTDPQPTPSSSSIPSSSLPPSNLFSGQLQNCVFNFYAK